MSNPIKPTLKSEIFALVLILITVVSAVYFYNNLPARIITHWNFAGQPDGWGSSKVQSVALPSMVVGMYLLFLALPYFDPKKDRYEQFAKTYHIFKNLLLALFVIIFFITGLSNLGYNVPVGVIIPLLIGLMFIIMGNYFGKIKPNWFMGIRTPWTLSSEEVWNKTHRFGGKMFILAGLLMIAEIFLPLSWKLPIFIIMMVILLFGTTGYSYVVYLQEKKKNTN
jgi:uncharacterized membrane protein